LLASLARAWVAKEKIGTLLLASEMPLPIPPSRTVVAAQRAPYALMEFMVKFFNGQTKRSASASIDEFFIKSSKKQCNSGKA
jgi:hypothetical protein